MLTYFIVIAIVAIFNVPLDDVSNNIEYLCFTLCVINDLTMISRAVNSGGKG